MPSGVKGIVSMFYRTEVKLNGHNHYCPVKVYSKSCNTNNNNVLTTIKRFFDLKFGRIFSCRPIHDYLMNDNYT